MLIALLRAHVNAYGTAPDGRLFRETRGGPLSESVYGRAWHAARTLALGPDLAASGLTRRPYDLRHAWPAAPHCRQSTVSRMPW